MATYQVIKPSCVVIGIDLHTAIGLTPPALVLLTPKKYHLWVSVSTARWIIGDQESSNVLGQGVGLVKRGSDTRYLRPHLCCSWPVPVITPICDLVMWIPLNLLGATKTIWGPYSVKANITGTDDNPAVMLIGESVGVANSTICSDPCDLPLTISMQAPSSVRAGMTWADILGNVITTVIDCAISFALNWGIGKLLEGGQKKLLTTLQAQNISKPVRDRLAKSLQTTADRWRTRAIVYLRGSLNVPPSFPTFRGADFGPGMKFAEDFVTKATGDLIKDGYYFFGDFGGVMTGVDNVVGNIAGPDEKGGG
ncbi:hypothetical protein LVJ94_27890 [Pendulispora rubella]|uniref:Uncharacterized protein n=1 Tax=Pendulispora rubella TaxID=2741070 RepID=A0ABZ2KTX6_9BACT